MYQKIKNYENYIIYEDGALLNTTTNRFLKGKVKPNGYRVYTLSKDNVKKDFYVHRLVAEYFIPNPDKMPVVNHKDGNKLNNNFKNLEWTTYSENTKHWHDNNKNIQRKLTEYYQNDDLEGETWIEFLNYYVSSCGRVRHKTKNNLLHPVITSGYYKVRLSQNGLVNDFLIHQLVYKLFKGEYDKTQYIIDHIDGDKLNNNINNLRLLSRQENVLAAYYEQKTNQSAKLVYQYDLYGNLLNTFPSAAEAARQLNLDSSTISKVCRGVNKTHGGYIFKYDQNKI